MCRPEKGLQIDAIRSRAVRSLQPALRTKYYEMRAPLRVFAATGVAVSLRFRLAGGGRGIRTPGTLSGTAVFKTARFNHSRIPPGLLNSLHHDLSHIRRTLGHNPLQLTHCRTHL
jgi:hypothetical protein